MKLVIRITLTAVTLVSALVVGRYLWTERDPATAAPFAVARPSSMTAKQRAELKSLLDALGLSLDRVEETTETNSGSGPYTTVRFQVQRDSRKHRTCIGQDGGRIISYGIEHYTLGDDPVDASLEGKTKADAISAEEAFRRAVPLLKYYRQSDQIGDYTLELEDRRDATPGDLWGCRWSVYREFSYRGIPYRGASIHIGVLASSGEVFCADYFPVVVPNEPRRRIPVDEAVVTAKLAVKKYPYLISHKATVGEGNVQEVIGYANDHFLAADVLKWHGDYPRRSSYCWAVPITLVDKCAIIGSFLWVDVENGNVIGADTRVTPEQSNTKPALLVHAGESAPVAPAIP